VFSNLLFITLPNIEKYFFGIHFPWNSLSKKKLLSSKQTGPYLVAASRGRWWRREVAGRKETLSSASSRLSLSWVACSLSVFVSLCLCLCSSSFVFSCVVHPPVLSVCSQFPLVRGLSLFFFAPLSSVSPPLDFFLISPLVCGLLWLFYKAIWWPLFMCSCPTIMRHERLCFFEKKQGNNSPAIAGLFNVAFRR